MVSKEPDFSIGSLLQIVTDNLSKSVVLDRKLQQDIINATGKLAEKCSKLELENQKLKDENAQLKQKLNNNESTSAVCQRTNSQHILEQLQQEVFSIQKGLIAQLITIRTAWDAELLEYNEGYEKCKKDLQKLNLKISCDAFDNKLQEYKNTCQKNDLSRKEAFKMLYQIDMVSKDKLEKEKEQNSIHLKGIQLFVRNEKDKLEKVKELIDNFLNKERKLYEDALYHGKQGTALYSNLLTNSGNIDKSESVSPSARASPKVDANVESSSTERSIILLNFPNDSLSEILDFLNNLSTELNLKEENIEMTKTFHGRTYSNLKKITLPSKESVNKILKGEDAIRADFKGISISLYEYK